MPKQQFKAQADICKKALDILHKAIELDPGNAEEYQAGIAYTEGVMKASNAIVKACEIVEPTKKQKAEPKAEEAEPKNKKVKATTKKSKSKEEPKPVIEVEPAPVEEKEAEDLFAMFGD
ncbi:MAG: hypothetical protein Q619_VDC00007G0009 [Veillonella dispar DORA_11]|uniref:Uncharacterized protein n=2 Tax=root TaxID=1 RepID=W1V8T6_9FIRM|nr:MAG: hypothetical protein Q619_VDC00007G0009 [Veillonella dispar DORA_11]